MSSEIKIKFFHSFPLSSESGRTLISVLQLYIYVKIYATEYVTSDNYLQYLLYFSQNVSFLNTKQGQLLWSLATVTVTFKFVHYILQSVL